MKAEPTRKRLKLSFAAAISRLLKWMVGRLPDDKGEK
jgi:hypothetical protein